MKATATLSNPRSLRGFVLVVVAMLCALVLGAAGGYAAHSQKPATGGAPQTRQLRVDANPGEGGQSDLTRAQPTEAPSVVSGAEYAIPDSGLIP